MRSTRELGLRTRLRWRDCSRRHAHPALTCLGLPPEFTRDMELAGAQRAEQLPAQPAILATRSAAGPLRTPSPAALPTCECDRCRRSRHRVHLLASSDQSGTATCFVQGRMARPLSTMIPTMHAALLSDACRDGSRQRKRWRRPPKCEVTRPGPVDHPSRCHHYAPHSALAQGGTSARRDSKNRHPAQSHFIRRCPCRHASPFLRWTAATSRKPRVYTGSAAVCSASEPGSVRPARGSYGRTRAIVDD